MGRTGQLLAGEVGMARGDKGVIQPETRLPVVGAEHLPRPESLTTLMHEVVNGGADFTDLIAALSPLICGTGTLGPDTALAMAMALGDIEQQSLHDDKALLLVERQAAPAVALLPSGVVAALNAGTRQLFGVQPGEGHEALGVDRTAFLAFRQRLFECQGSSLLKVRTMSSQRTPLVMVGSYQHEARVFLLTALQHAWPTSIDRALEDLFGLSLAEREVLAGLAQGASAEAIALQRQRTLGTVRQQIKSILQKMGASTQVQAASFAAAAAYAVGDAGNVGDRLPTLEGSALATGEFLRQGRRVGWRRFGRAGGTPVLLLHGPFFGLGEYDAERECASRLGLDVLAVERLGYGRTEAPLSLEDAVDCQVADILALLDREGWRSVRLLCHDIAFLPALALCRQAGARVLSLTAVSAPAPFREAAQLDLMPGQQKLFMWAARHAGWLVRLLIRLGMVQMRKLGPENWIEAVFGESPLEMEVLRQPACARGLPGAFAFNLAQSGKGYEIDLALTTRDWGDAVRDLRHPCTLFHGSQNQTTRPEFNRMLLQLNPSLVRHEIEGAGQTLALTHGEMIWRHVASS